MTTSGLANAATLESEKKQSINSSSTQNNTKTTTYEPSSDKTAVRRSSQRRFGGAMADKPPTGLSTLEPPNLGPSRPPLYVPTTRRDSQKRELTNESEVKKTKNVPTAKDPFLNLGLGQTDSPYQLKPDLINGV